MATPYRISIGVNIDASGAKAGSSDAKQAVASIGAEAEKAAPKIEGAANAVRKLESMGGNNGAAASIDAIRTAAVAAVPSMDRLINTFAGITAPASNDNGRAADIAAYGAELDRLRARFDPLFAAQQRYKQKIEEINQAERVGAITASIAIEARLREANAYDGLISKVERLNAARKASAQNIVDRQTITPDRGADVEAYGRSLDQLRARYNPLYAVITQYKQAQLEIRNAHAVGAISADEMSAAISRQRQATLQSIDAIKGRNNALSDTPANRGAAFNTSNLAAQGFDIGATAAFMPWWTVALQQGPQVAQVFNDIKASGQSIGPAVAGAFMQILNPVSLLTIGTIGATAAAIQYFSSVSSGTKTVDEILARHQENIDALGPAYQRALADQQKYAMASEEVLNARLGDNAKNAQEALVAAARDAYTSIRGEMQGNIWGSRGDNSMFRFDGAKEAIAEFLTSIEAGTPKVGAFEAQIAKLEQTRAISPEAAKELREFIAEALNAETQLDGITGKVDPVALAFSELQKSIDGVNPFNATGRLGDMSGELDKLWRNMRAGRVDTTDLTRELDRLRTINPDMSGVIDEIERLGRVALATLANVQSLANVGTLGKSGRNPLADRNDSRRDDLDLFLRTDDDLTDKLKAQADELERAAQKSSRAGSSARNAYRDLIKSADDRIEQMKLEAEMAGKVGVEADALRFSLDLLQQAEDKGRTISEKQRAEIAKKVEAFKEYAEAAATAKLRADLLWESEQAARSSVDRQVAARLRSSGLDIDFETYEAELIRMNLALEVSKSYAAEFSDTLFDGLAKGEDLFDTLADAGIAAFKRLGKSLWDDVLNSLFSIGGGGGSGGGLFSGIFSGIFGGGFKTNTTLGDYLTTGFSGTASAAAGSLGAASNGARIGVAPLLPANRSVDQVASASASAISRLKIELGLASDGALNLRPEVVGVVQETAPDMIVDIVEQNNEGEAARVAGHNQHTRWR